MSISRLISKLKCKLYHRIKPLLYAEKVGVNFPKGELHLYGNIDWGTEPWIISVGRNVHITDGVKFITHDGGTLLFRNIIPDLEITKPIILGDDVYVGNNVLIMPGITIGNRVVIGAGAIVTKDIPDNTVVAGVPAKIIKTTDEYLEKIKGESLHLGHLKGESKDKALMKYYGYKGNSRGIYL